MKRVGAALLVMILSTAMSVAGDQDAERMLKAAMNADVVDGNVKAAIDQYKHIVDLYGKTDRVTSARALLRLAEAYQKLGDAQAAQTYQRLLREFGDQAEAAAIARARLGNSESVAARRGDRPVWTGPDADGFGTISPDGRFMTYTHFRSGGRLMRRDLGTGTDRPLTDSNEGSTQFSVISKNGKEVAYQWFPRPGGSAPELRISSLETGNTAAPRRLQFSEDLGGVAPFDWSADGKWLAVQVSRKDHTNQIGLVTVQDGALRVMKSTEWREPIKIFFSPDSRYIAYDLPVSETSDERHLYVMATDGSVETEAVRHQSSNVVMGWSRDGRHLLFSSNRGGSTGLWAVPMSSGKPVGVPSLVQTDIASSWSLGTTSDGTIYAWRDRRGLSVQTAQVDLAAGKLLPSDKSEQFIRSRGRPEWSADGKQIAYHSCNGLGGGPCTVLIWTLESGTTRELPTRVRYQQGLHWSPDGQSLLTIGNDFKGRRAVYRIDTQTGDLTVVMNTEDTQVPLQVDWAADGRGIYYRQRTPGSLVVVKRDLTSGAEQVVLKTPADNSSFFLSRDNRSIAYAARNGTARTVHVASLPGGESRLLLQATDPEEIRPVAWTPDDRALLVVKTSKGVMSELWLVPVDGTQSRKIDGDITNWTPDGSISLSPDGTRVTFVRAAGQPGYEIWAFDSYLSALNARRESKQ